MERPHVMVLEKQGEIRTIVTSKIGIFEALIRSFQTLTNDTKSSILGVGKS